MHGNGNDLKTLFRKLYFMLLPTCGMRSRYLQNRKSMFHALGENVMFQPRKFPSDPELISIGNNVLIAADVKFINHDIIHAMLNRKYSTNSFKALGGCIEIGDNVMIGTGTYLMPNISIGNNVVIAAGSIVTKDIPDNCVVGGIPAVKICDFDTIVNKRKDLKIDFTETPDKIWLDFHRKRDKM